MSGLPYEATATAVAPGQPAHGGFVTGKITRVAVTYTVNTPDGPRHTFHGLAHMHRHIRPERVSELLDALTVICEELAAVREPMPGNGLAGLPRRAR